MKCAEICARMMDRLSVDDFLAFAQEIMQREKEKGTFDDFIDALWSNYGRTLCNTKD